MSTTGNWHPVTGNRFLHLLILVLITLSIRSNAQFFPIQSTTQLIPPYSVYLSDYATPGEDKLRVILLHRDLTQPAYQLRLMMMVEWNGKVIMRTSRAFSAPPISIDPGVPTVISGAELAPYLDSRNIDFVGYSRDQYERTKALPEGAYRICFIAYDYRRQDVQVSNEGCSFYYLSKSEPPMLNLPACGDLITARTPQQIIFSWLPRNTASPNSAGDTYYEFSLFETRPAGRNPNDVVLTTNPIYRVETDFTQLVYGPAEPLLLENMNYVWRVRAIDRNGKDAFRNNGYSEVCTFRLGADPQFDIGVVRGFQAEAQAERKAKIWWDVGEFDGYRVLYKKTGKGFEWFTSDTKAQEIKLYDLEPDTEYETRIQAIKNGTFGPYSETLKFRTPPMRVAQCGDNTPLPTAPGKPLPFATQGMIILASGMEITLTQIDQTGQDGWYKGMGRVSIDYLAGASFAVKFDRIFIDEERNVTNGRIDFLSKGIAAMAEEQFAGQKKRQLEQKQQQNRDEWKDTQFQEKIFYYGDISIDTVTVNADGSIAVADPNGIIYNNTEIPTILNKEPEKAIIIEDKNGDQYVVQKDKDTGKTKVSKVEGGGLTPNGNVQISREAMDIVKKALRELRGTYDDKSITSIKTDLENRRSALEKLREQNNAQMVSVANPRQEQESTAQSLYFDFVEIEGVQTNDEFSRQSIQLKEKELEFNRAMLIQYVSRDLDKKDDYKLVARDLTIESKPVSEFVASQKASNTPIDQITTKVKEEIVLLIDKVFINYSVNNK